MAAVEKAAAEKVVASIEESPGAEVDESQTEAEAALTADEWRTRGNAAVKSGDHETAFECYSSGIGQVGSDGEAEALLRSNRAMCLHKLGRYEEAVGDAERCVHLKPEFVKGYLRGAMALRAAGRPAEALALLKRAPRNDEAGSLAAEIRPEAEAAERTRINALPEAERAKEEGNVLFRKGLFEAAAEKYTDALRLCKEPEGTLALSIRNNRAACYHQISDFNAVIKDTSFVLEREPRNSKALLRRMLALEPLERYEQALQDARGVLVQDPRNEIANKVQHRLGKLVRDLSRANGGA
jgi:tetratricopeptide (TPR) repeat protein